MPRTFELFGQEFRLTDKPNKYALTRFLALAGRQGEVDEGTASATVMDFLERCIHPDDWQRFDRACMDNDADWEKDLTPIVGMVYEQSTDRPTARPSGSSAGPQNIEPKSTVVSSSPAIALVPATRPDLGLIVSMAEEARRTA